VASVQLATSEGMEAKAGTLKSPGLQVFEQSEKTECRQQPK